MPTRTMGPGAGVTRGSPSDRLDDESGAVVHRRTRRLTVAIAVAAHLIGTGVVLVLLVFVLPVPPEFEGWTPGSAQLVRRNLVAAIAYVGLIVPAGVALGRKQADPATRWLREERAPTERERELALGLGLRLLRMQTGLWAGGVVLFYLLNASTSGLLAFEIAITVGLGGVTTAAVAYLLTERNTRSTIARALAGAPPRSYRVPGVATRALFAWALGTAVPVIGVVAIAAVSLALPVSAHRVAATALCLGVIALVVGLGAMVIFAQSISDPLRILRRALVDVEAGSLEPRVVVDDGSEVGFLQAGFNRMVSGLRERERLRDLFGRHVGHDVARPAGRSLAGAPSRPDACGGCPGAARRSRWPRGGSLRGASVPPGARGPPSPPPRSTTRRAWPSGPSAAPAGS